ncbi:carboxypeptidase-like regulatory domain-containing protein [Halomonadaceae bacterium KBTZ08]
MSYGFLCSRSFAFVSEPPVAEAKAMVAITAFFRGWLSNLGATATFQSAFDYATSWQGDIRGRITISCKLRRKAVMGKHKLTTLSLVIASSVALTACGGSSSSDGDAESGTGDGEEVNQYSVSGQAVDGPIEDASITLIDSNGNVVFEGDAVTDEDGEYTIEFEAEGEVATPLEVVLEGGTDTVTEQPLVGELNSLVMELGDEQARANINPSSTLIAKTAMALKDQADEQANETLSQEQFEQARQSVAENLDLVLDNPIQQDPEDGKVAAFLQEQQVLGESLKRSANENEFEGLPDDAEFGQKVAAAARALGEDLASGDLDARDSQGNPLDINLGQSLDQKRTEVKNEIAQGMLNHTGENGTMAGPIQDITDRLNQVSDRVKSRMEERNNRSGDQTPEGGSGGNTDGDDSDDGNTSDGGDGAPSTGDDGNTPANDVGAA